MTNESGWVLEEPYEHDWRKRSVGRPRICTPLIEGMKELRRKGWTFKAISMECGVCQMTVYRYCKDVKKNE